MHPSSNFSKLKIIIYIIIFFGNFNVFAFMSSMDDHHSHHHNDGNSLRISNNSHNVDKTHPQFANNSREKFSPVQMWNDDLPFSVALEPDGRLVYSWDWDEQSKVARIHVHAKVSKQAWIALGFSNDGSFNDADFCVYFVDSRHAKHLYDAWTDGEGVMHVDAHQDCRLLAAFFDEHAQLVLRFERALDTCDDPYDYVIEDGTTHVVYALGIGTINSVEGVALSDPNHVYGGFERITFTKPHLKPISYPSDTKIIDITAAQVHVSSDETTYWCIVQKLPDLTTKNHIIRYEAVISPGSEDLVHHIEVFHCELPAATKVPTYQGMCHAENRPKALDRCTRVIGAWAMGAPPLGSNIKRFGNKNKKFIFAALKMSNVANTEYPVNAGYPIGGQEYSSYVLIEMHYNNPQHKTGIVDSSGIRFYVTATLRQFDIGVMELGLEYTPKMAIPPLTKSTALTGHCIAECTQAGLPPDGIVIFASQLHTHLTGVRVETRHIRNGIELPLLNGDKHFNSKFQEIRRLRRPVRILPGDELLTTCEYNTLSRPNVTLGGYGITDEMCVNYVHYYPRTNLEVCKSSVDSNALADFFDFLKTQNGDAKIDSALKSVEENYRIIRYTPLIAGLQAQFYRQAPLAMQCNNSDGTRFAGSWNRQHQIRVDRPLAPPERVCPQDTEVTSATKYKQQRQDIENLSTKLTSPKLLFIDSTEMNRKNQTISNRILSHHRNAAPEDGRDYKIDAPQKSLLDQLLFLAGPSRDTGKSLPKRNVAKFIAPSSFIQGPEEDDNDLAMSSKQDYTETNGDTFTTDNNLEIDFPLENQVAEHSNRFSGPINLDTLLLQRAQELADRSFRAADVPSFDKVLDESNARVLKRQIKDAIRNQDNVKEVGKNEHAPMLHMHG